MKSSQPTLAVTQPIPGENSLRHLEGLRPLLFALGALALCFSKPLYDLIRFCAKSDLYSHILLIPFISLYLIWIKRSEYRRSRRGEQADPGSKTLVPWSLRTRTAIAPFLLGLAAIAAYWISIRSGWQPRTADYLALTVFAFVAFTIATCMLFLSRKALRTMRFALCFLIFMVPFPTILQSAIAYFLQKFSADAAYAMFNLAGTPLLRNGFEFRLPGMTIEVAPECSGIHSTLVLFIVSLLAGHLFLRQPWKRAALTLFVIPLAILRNGFRIFTIGELCVYVSPDMINSPIHHRGGPIFFALSLIPFFLLLLLLKRGERARHSPENPTQP